MPFDESLAASIRSALGRKKGVEEKKMFGSLCFLLRGNLLAGVWKDSMIVRLGPDEAEQALREPHVGAFDVTGKPMRNWVMVAAEGVTDEEAVLEWVQRAVRFVGKLPAK